MDTVSINSMIGITDIAKKKRKFPEHRAKVFDLRFTNYDLPANGNGSTLWQPGVRLKKNSLQTVIKDSFAHYVFKLA
jgi:hypothetical protein